MDEGGGSGGQARRGAGVERGHSPWKPPHHPELSSWEAAAAYAHTCMHTDTHTKVSSFLHILLGEHCSHHHPAQVTSHPWRLTCLISSHSGLSVTHDHIGWGQRSRTHTLRQIHLINTYCTKRGWGLMG